MPVTDELICTTILLGVAGILGTPVAVGVGLLNAFTALLLCACVFEIEVPVLTFTLAGCVVGLTAALAFETPWLALALPFAASLKPLGR